jgi:hypothetical protein
MKTYIFILAVMLALVLATTACGNRLGVTVAEVSTVAAQTVDVQVPLPEEITASPVLNLEFIGGELNLAPGAEDALVSGTAEFNVTDFAPKIEAGAAFFTVTTGDFEITDVAKFQKDFINRWALKLADIPMTLNIQAGAYTGRFELGGLSLEKLSIAEGGSDLVCSFSEPNKVQMSSFAFETGGSTLVLKGLANANFEQMRFNGGAGDYTLSFDGSLQRDAAVTVDAGVGTVNIIVPPGVNARVNFEGGLSSVNISGGWEQNNSTYTLTGSGPVITITVEMGLGTLNLKTA